jgi:hypothetical protein
MPPFSYVAIGVALACLVAIGLYVTHGYAILLFYWAFGAAACVMALVGVFRISYGVAAPLWVAAALASPAIMWAVERVVAWRAPSSTYIALAFGFRMGAFLAVTAAAIACIRLIEIVAAPNVLTRIAYGILVVGLGLTLLGIVQYAVGATWTRNTVYSEFAKWVRWPILIAKYGSFIAAPILLVARRNVEWWTLIPIVSIAAGEAYFAAFASQSTWTRHFPLFHGLWFWLKPVAFFIAGVAIWRMGSVLLSQRVEKKALSGVTG